ncbi:MAG: S-methyl-5'-thioinosine phosphorylase [Bacillota bacterium]|nr:S-methyl-5'-thioinosine phosphorylase [Bacillota bacterium]
MKKAIIGGTGVYGMPGSSRQQTIQTPFGNVEVDIVTVSGEEIVFLARHGKNHSVPPHLINYRANIKALAQLGISHIFATAAVGSCNDHFFPGDLVMITDFLDFTKTRQVTYFDGCDEPVGHVDMTDPYCPCLRRRCYAAADEEGVSLKGDAVYVCTEGPRFESAAEIRMFKQLGGDVVGMTNIPEIALARELGMCYAALGMVTNWCTGMKQEQIALHDIQAALGDNRSTLTRLFLKVFQQKLSQDHCTCRHSVIKL